VPTAPPTDRLTILLTGVDSSRDRNHALTDTLLVLSVNRDTNEAVMLSLPRDIANFPLYSGGTFRGKINALMSTAERDKDRFPDGAMGTLTRQVGFLIGIPVDHYASVNLDGFRRMVDLVGGVDIDNPRWINDPAYDWLDGTYGFRLAPGEHHLNGRMALAYVRSRMGAGDNDFTRAARQQQLLVALRTKLADPGILNKLPAILEVASTTIRTDFPADEVPENLVLAQQIGDDAIQRYVLGPPYSIHPPTSSTGGIYTLNLDFDRMAALSIELFGGDSAYAEERPASWPAP
jgi:LCP family protein required for cell wall assembly